MGFLVALLGSLALGAISCGGTADAEKSTAPGDGDSGTATGGQSSDIGDPPNGDDPPNGGGNSNGNGSSDGGGTSDTGGSSSSGGEAGSTGAGDPLESLLQNACVHRELGPIYFPEGRSLDDGRPCGNYIYTSDDVCGTDPLPIASPCVHYCAFERCQPEPCEVDTDCDWMIESTNTEYECVNYTIEELNLGKWCREKDPEPPPGLCDPCGGAFCDGDCAQCPQCTG